MNLCRIACFFGIHKWSAPLEDYLHEFGILDALKPGNIASTSKCTCCGKMYSNTKRDK